MEKELRLMICLIATNRHGEILLCMRVVTSDEAGGSSGTDHWCLNPIYSLSYRLPTIEQEDELPSILPRALYRPSEVFLLAKCHLLWTVQFQKRGVCALILGKALLPGECPVYIMLSRIDCVLVDANTLKPTVFPRPTRRRTQHTLLASCLYRLMTTSL